MHRLRALGYIEGQNLILERRSAEGRLERFGEIIREVVRLKMDAIVTVGDAMTQEAKAVTTTVPIVMTLSLDPVGAGLVSSLAHPGGNITGLTSAVDAEIEAKRLELLKETLPRISRVACLGLKGQWDSGVGESVRAASRVLGLTLVLVEHTPNDFTSAFRRIERDRPDALFVGSHPSGWVHRELIVDFATRSRLPSIHSQRETRGPRPSSSGFSRRGPRCCWSRRSSRSMAGLSAVPCSVTAGTSVRTSSKPGWPSRATNAVTPAQGAMSGTPTGTPAASVQGATPVASKPSRRSPAPSTQAASVHPGRGPFP